MQIFKIQSTHVPLTRLLGERPRITKVNSQQKQEICPAVGPTQLAIQWVSGTSSRGTFHGVRHWSRTSTHCRGWECVGATSPLPHWPSWRNALLSTVQFTLTYSVWLTFQENNVIN